MVKTRQGYLAPKPVGVVESMLRRNRALRRGRRRAQLGGQRQGQPRVEGQRQGQPQMERQGQPQPQVERQGRPQVASQIGQRQDGQRQIVQGQSDRNEPECPMSLLKAFLASPPRRGSRPHVPWSKWNESTSTSGSHQDELATNLLQQMKEIRPKPEAGATTSNDNNPNPITVPKPTLKKQNLKPLPDLHRLPSFRVLDSGRFAGVVQYVNVACTPEQRRGPPRRDGMIMYGNTGEGKRTPRGGWVQERYAIYQNASLGVVGVPRVPVTRSQRPSIFKGYPITPEEQEEEARNGNETNDNRGQQQQQQQGSSGGGVGGGPKPPQFKVNEKVLCYEPDIKKAQVLYDSKVLEVVRKQDPISGVYYEYKIHFQGWKCTWDRYVHEDNVLKTSIENRELQKQLRARVDEDKAMQKKKKKKISIKEKIQAVQEAVSSSSVGKERTTSKSKGKGTKGKVIQNVKKVRGHRSTDGGMEAKFRRTSEQLLLPDDLKIVLEYDFNKIRRRKWLVKLPCAISVVEILEEYIHYFGRLEIRSYVQRVQGLMPNLLPQKNGNGIESRVKHRQTTPITAKPSRQMVDAVNQELIRTMQRVAFMTKTVEDICVMFDVLLPQILLYRNEHDQYNQYLNGDFKPKPKRVVVRRKRKRVVIPPKPVEEDPDDLIVQNVIKKNMPPPPVPPLKRRTRSAGNPSISPPIVVDLEIKSKRGRKSTSALPSTSTSALLMSGSGGSSSTRAASIAEIDPTQPLEMMPLSEIKLEPLDEPEIEPPIKRRKEGTASSGGGEVIVVHAPRSSSSLPKGQTTSRKDKKSLRKSRKVFREKVNVPISPAALLSSDKFCCVLEDECDFPWACQHLNKFMEEFGRYQLRPPSSHHGEYPHPSLCYGFQHLLRLFVRMPEVLCRTTVPRKKMGNIVREMNRIISYFSYIKGIVSGEDWHCPGIVYAEDYINERNCHLFAKGTPSRKMLRKSKKKFKKSKEKRRNDKKSKQRCLVSKSKKSKKRSKDKRRHKSTTSRRHQSPSLRMGKVAARFQVTGRNSRRSSGKVDPSSGGSIPMGIRKSLTQEELSRETLVAASIPSIPTTSTSTPPQIVTPKINTGSSSSSNSKPKTSYSLRHQSRKYK